MRADEIHERWHEAKVIWQQNQWLYALVGFFLGIVISQFLQNFTGTFSDLLASLMPEAIGIGFTVLIIDRMYQNHENQRMLDTLIRDMSSSSNEIAKRAVEELQAKGLLENGTLIKCDLKNANLQDARIGFGRDYVKDEFPRRAILQEVNFRRANLENAKLHHVDLRRSNMSVTNLRYANLFDANLQEADLFEADLCGADLRNTELSGAILDRANLENAILEDTYGSAIFSENTMLPDGSFWRSGTDMQRFTNAKHPHFWRSSKGVPEVENACGVSGGLGQ